jgi:hypothetical protein
VARESAGVTATRRDDGHELIFLAGDGIWILRKDFAEDPAVAKADREYVIYNH